MSASPSDATLTVSPDDPARSARAEAAPYLLVIEGNSSLLCPLPPSGEQRGRGLGAAVFGALLDQYPDALEIRLTVNRQNYKSINFYFKIGFIIESCLDIPIGEGYVMNDFQMLWRRSR